MKFYKVNSKVTVNIKKVLANDVDEETKEFVQSHPRSTYNVARINEEEGKWLHYIELLSGKPCPVPLYYDELLPIVDEWDK